MNLLLISIFVSIFLFVLLLITEKSYTVKHLIVSFFFCLIPFFNVFCIGFFVLQYLQENKFLQDKIQEIINFINSILNYKIK